MTKFLRILADRLRALLRGKAVTRELEDEFNLHIELETRANITLGMNPDDARRRAMRTFGNLGRIRDAALDVRGGGKLETILQDLSYAIRISLKNPGFTIVAALTLALGIGANTAVFSAVNSVLLHPLPYKDSDRLVDIFGRAPGMGPEFNHVTVSDAEALYFHDRSQVLQGSFAYIARDFNLTGAGSPERVAATAVTADLFSVLGVAPSLGRSFREGEDRPGQEKVTILSFSLWSRRFGQDPNVVGRTISLDQVSHTVVGIAPPDFHFPNNEVQLWVPLVIDPASLAPSSRDFSMIARLRSGFTIEEARAEADSLTAQLFNLYPKFYPRDLFEKAGFGIGMLPLHETVVGKIKPALMVLFGTVFFVLLIGCANVAGLMSARAEGRHKEMAIRTALGASRARLIRQLLTESGLLALFGCAIGLLLAYFGGRAFLSLKVVDIPHVERIAIDARVLGFVLGLSLLSALVFGLAPALQISKSDLNDTLKEGAKGSSGGPNRRRIRGLLVVFEVAMALALLIGAGLMIKSFVGLQNTNPGLSPRNVLTMELSLPTAKYPDELSRALFLERLLEKMRALPAVSAAGSIGDLPLRDENGGGEKSIEMEGRPFSLTVLPPNPDYTQASPGYFRAMSIPLLAGRDFKDSDRAGAPLVAIVNQRAANDFWPAEDPVGKKFRDVALEGPVNPWFTVIGIVGDVRIRTLAQEPRPEIYFSQLQTPQQSASLVIRTVFDPEKLTAAVRGEIQSMDSDLPISRVETMEHVVSGSFSQSRFATVTLASFAGLALVLAAMGLYGVVSYSVSQMTHEIGIRMALGARSSEIVTMVVRQGLMLILAGLGIGLVTALVLTRFLSSLLYGISSVDITTFAGVPVLLTVVALMASYIPARRAARVAPMEALRVE